MGKYRVTTDQGVFEVTTDEGGDPSGPGVPNPVATNPQKYVPPTLQKNFRYHGQEIPWDAPVYASPAMPSGVATAPLQFAAKAAIGAGTGYATERGLKALGAPDDLAEAGGTAAGFATGFGPRTARSIKAFAKSPGRGTIPDTISNPEGGASPSSTGDDILRLAAAKVAPGGALKTVAKYLPNLQLGSRTRAAGRALVQSPPAPRSPGWEGMPAPSATTPREFTPQPGALPSGRQPGPATGAPPAPARAPAWQGLPSPSAETPTPEVTTPTAALPSGRKPGGIQSQTNEPPTYLSPIALDAEAKRMGFKSFDTLRSDVQRNAVRASATARLQGKPGISGTTQTPAPFTAPVTPAPQPKPLPAPALPGHETLNYITDETQAKINNITRQMLEEGLTADKLKDLRAKGDWKTLDDLAKRALEKGKQLGDVPQEHTGYKTFGPGGRRAKPGMKSSLDYIIDNLFHSEAFRGE